MHMIDWLIQEAADMTHAIAGPFLKLFLADLGGLEADERAAPDDLPDDPRNENQKESNGTVENQGFRLICDGAQINVIRPRNHELKQKHQNIR